MTATHSIAPTLLVAIDVSKHRHEVLIGIPGKTRRRRLTVMNTLEDFRRLTAEHAGLDGGEIQAAELQELTVMPEAVQVTGLGQDGQGVDRADTGNGRQQLIIGQTSPLPKS